MIDHDQACAGGETAGGATMPPHQRPEETVDLVARTIARAQLDRPQRDALEVPGSPASRAALREGLLGAAGLAAFAGGGDGGDTGDLSVQSMDDGDETDFELGPHPSTETLWRFMTGGLEPDEMRQALRHLLHGCQACQEVAREVWNLTPTSAVVPAPGVAIVPIAARPVADATAPTVAGAREAARTGSVDEPQHAAAEADRLAEPASSASQPSLDAAYDAVLDRVFARVAVQEAAIEAARRRAAGLFEELMQHPPARQDLLVNNSARFRDRMLCENLVSAGHNAGFREPARSQHLARLAVAIAERLSVQAGATGKAEVEEPGGMALVGDSIDLLDGLRARAWAQLGNALRIGADLEGAGAAFDAAEAVLAANQRIGLLDVARVLDLRASLYRDLRELHTAGRLLDRVIGIYRRLGQSNLLGRVLNQKAMVLAEAGDARSSMALLRRALDLLDPREEPRWFLTVRHNLICTLLADSRPREAFALLFHTRPLYLKMGDRMNLLRLRWVEGAVAQALDRLEQAEAAFREVREAFVELGIAYDAALVSLDLAAIYARQGRTAEVRRLAQEMMAFFAARQIHREAMAAFLFFCDAVRIEKAAGGMLRVAQDVASFLKQARNAPDLRFSPHGPSS